MLEKRLGRKIVPPVVEALMEFEVIE